MLANLLQDVRYALHGFASRPMFAAVVVLTLAVGIGVNVAVFSLYDQLMLRELPVARPSELVKVVSPGPRAGNQLGNQQGTDDETFSYPLFRDLEAAGKPDVDLAASWIAQLSLGNGERTVRGAAVLVSGGYFSTLGVGPSLGRVLGEQDVVGTQPSAVVLSFDYWTSAFGADPSVLGKTLVVGGQPLEIVGVAPRGFVGTTPGSDPSVFAPITLEWYRNAALPSPIVEDRFFTYLYVFGRLRAGASLDAAQAKLDAAFRAIVNDVEAPAMVARPGYNANAEFEAKFRARTLSLVPGARGQSRAPLVARTPLAVFFAATATILLIACVNLANLMFARGSARVGEIAVRASLGAARRRLYALLSTEALLLAGVGALLSLPVALGVLHTVDALQPSGLRVIAINLDVRMAAIAFAIGAFAAVSFALAPMTKLVGADPMRALQSGGARTFGGKNLGRFRFVLATTQIALSMLLLVLAALFTGSLVNAARVDLGLRTESIVTFYLAPSLNLYSMEQGARALESVERELAAQPGVTAVSTSSVPLLSGSQWRTSLLMDGSDQTQNVSANEVGPGLFTTLDIPVLQGRGFTEADTRSAPKVAIVNERFVEHFGLGANPVGRRFRFNPREPADVEIVGVVRDAAYDAVKAPFVPQVITPRAQSENFGVGAAFYVRTTQAADAVLAAIPRIVASVDSNLPVMDARTFGSQVRRSLQTDWLLVTLAGVLAVIATLLAAIGLYGVLSYMVAQRTREIGLRLALGAEPDGVRRMVLRQVVWMAGVGVPAGIVAALVVGRFAASQLFGLAPTDPRAVIAAALVLVATVLGASYWPARKASRVDPMAALRAE
jgi:predicted permease